MRYRVAFAKRPSTESDLKYSEGVVARKERVEDPHAEASHGNAEIWEYVVVDARADEFEAALQKLAQVLEYDVVDSTVTTAGEAAGEQPDEK